MLIKTINMLVNLFEFLSLKLLSFFYLIQSILKTFIILNPIIYAIMIAFVIVLCGILKFHVMREQLGIIKIIFTGVINFPKNQFVNWFNYMFENGIHPYFVWCTSCTKENDGNIPNGDDFNPELFNRERPLDRVLLRGFVKEVDYGVYRWDDYFAALKKQMVVDAQIIHNDDFNSQHYIKEGRIDWQAWYQKKEKFVKKILVIGENYEGLKDIDLFESVCIYFELLMKVC